MVLTVLIYHLVMTLRIVVVLTWWFIMAVFVCGMLIRGLALEVMPSTWFSDKPG